jgi:hypothetical protein
MQLRSFLQPKAIIILLFLVSIIHFHNAGDKVAGDGYSYFIYCRNLFFYNVPH